MSARPEENDSDGSWTWVDNEEDNTRERVESRRIPSLQRTQIEQVHDDSAQESDISILTDSEDHPEAAAENVEQGTPLGSGDLENAKVHFNEMAAEMQKAAKVKAALDVARPGESELAVTERRVRSYLKSTLTSAGFMIGGLLIAAYCQWGCDGNYSSPVQEYYDRPYVDHDVEYIETDFRGSKYKKFDGYKNKNSLKYVMQTHKNAREKYEEKKPGQRESKRGREDEYQPSQKKQKKGEFKHKKDKQYKEYDEHDYDTKDRKKRKHQMDGDYREGKENYKPKEKKHAGDKKKHKLEKRDKLEKHDKNDRIQDQEEYLHKKEAYLKQKESKLKQKEFKLYAKDFSHENFNKQHDKHKQQKHDHYKHNDFVEKKFKKRKHNKYNETASGEWYENMHKGRKDKRQKEKQADWMFERAQGRNRKRDKAHWYFDMMDEREMNRVKKS